MAKKTRITIPEVKPPEPQPRRLGLLVCVFVVAFGLAFGLAWLVFRSGPAPVTPPPAEAEAERVDPPLTAEDMAPFLQAAAAADVETMFRLGPELFTKGRLIQNRREVLAEYETNSFPPYQVYAFYSGIGDGQIRRVLLTTDEDDKVEAFLAEAMPID